MKGQKEFRWMFLIAMITLLGTSFMKAQGKFGVGFMFGKPTGFAWKYRISTTNAIDGAIGFSPFDRGRLHVDYLWQSYPFASPRPALHYGIGAAIGFGNGERVVFDDDRRAFVQENDLGFGVRGIIGLTYLVPRSPVDLFVEVGPLLVLTPPTGVNLDGGFGARFYFP